MSLNPEWIATKNPVDMNGICDAIRDYFLEHALHKPICMTCDLLRTEHEDGSPPTWAGPIVFRVSDNSQEVVDEYAEILSHFTPTEPNTTDPYHWRLMNDIHYDLTKVEPSAEYNDWQPSRTILFQISLTESEFPKLVETVNRQILMSKFYGVVFNEWGWHPDEIEEYDRKHMRGMYDLWIKVKHIPEEV